MKKFILFSIFCCASGLMLIACQRDGNVFAGNDNNMYQPRPAPIKHVRKSDEVQGELLRVDVPVKAMAVRLENGVVQTFRFDDNTTFVGLESNKGVLDLAGKEGSELTVRWKDEGETRMATNVEVTQLFLTKARHGRKH